MYEVYLDDVFFYGVKTFNSPHDRKLTTYNGIGTGYFPKADDPNLKEWSWECQLQEYPEHYHDSNFSPAKAIFARLDAMLAKKDPVRLVMKSEYDSISEQVLLEGYQKKEVYAGVYNVSVNVTEYKEAAIRNTEIPEIPRPGKVPETPPSPVPEDETSYDKTQEAPESWEPEKPPGKGPSPGGGTVIDPETGGEITLPVDPPPDKDYEWTDSSKDNSYVNNITGEVVEAPGINWGNIWDSIKDTIFPHYDESVLGNISGSYEDFAKSQGWRDGYGYAKKMGESK